VPIGSTETVPSAVPSTVKKTQLATKIAAFFGIGRN